MSKPQDHLWVCVSKDVHVNRKVRTSQAVGALKHGFRFGYVDALGSGGWDVIFRVKS